MSSDLYNDHAKSFVVCAVILFFELFVSMAYQAKVSTALPDERPAEDQKSLAKAAFDATLEEGTAEYEAAKENLKRWRRIVGNQYENLPMDVLVLYIYATFSTDDDETVGMILVSLYTALRTIYVLMYAFAFPTGRAACWASSKVVVLISGILAIKAVM